MDSSGNTMMHALRGYVRFAHIEAKSAPTRPRTRPFLLTCTIAKVQKMHSE